MSREQQKILKLVEEMRDEFMISAVDYPKAEPFEHGVQIGEYRAAQKLLASIEAALREPDEA